MVFLNRDVYIIISYAYIIQRTRTDRTTAQPTQDEPIPVQKAFNYTRHEYWVVQLDRELQPGSVVWLDMSFEGSMIGRLRGFYLTSYIDSHTRQTRFNSLIISIQGWKKN